VIVPLDDPNNVLSGHVDFTLDPPGGALAAEPWQTLGWGLTIDNQSNGWVVIISTTCGQTASIGTFTDLLTSQFLNFSVAPGATWQSVALGPAGLGSYAIDGSFALPGDAAVGELDLLFDVHSVDPNDPNYDSTGDTQLPGQQALLPATDLPEPATPALTGLALLDLGLKAVRRRS